MELSIHIPDEIYERINADTVSMREIQLLLRIIKNGTIDEMPKTKSTNTLDELKEIREEIEHCSSRYNLAREQGCQGQVVWSEYLYKQGDVLAILDKKIAELEGK